MTRESETGSAIIRRMLDDAMAGTDLRPVSGSRWLREHSELIWVVEADRAPHGGDWAVQFGAVVRTWAAPGPSPHASDGHFYQPDYANHGQGLPAGATTMRLNDHRSYFAAAMHGDYDEITDDERLSAVTYLANDLSQLTEGVATLDDLSRIAISDEATSAFVHKRLRDMQHRS